MPVRGDGLASSPVTATRDAVVVGNVEIQEVWYGAGQPVTYNQDSATGRKHFGLPQSPSSPSRLRDGGARGGGSECPISGTDTVKLVGIWFPACGTAFPQRCRLGPGGLGACPSAPDRCRGRVAAHITPTVLGTDTANDIGTPGHCAPHRHRGHWARQNHGREAGPITCTSAHHM